MATTEEQQQEVRAEAKWVRTSPRKARLVAEHIRGRSVPEARTVLAFTPRAAAREVEKVLRSAVANAEANHGLDGDDLYVSAAYVDEGPTLKRWRARARGRVARIRKRTCHITIELAQGVSTSTAAGVPAMAAPEPEPVAEPEALEEPETVDEAEAEETEEVAEEPEAEVETEEPEAEAETPETEEGPSAEAEAEASTKETDR